MRYRAKIEDPKDAGVMLAALGVGLAAGVGLYWLSPFATVFLLVLLYILETSEPEAAVRFLLKVTAEDAGPHPPQRRRRAAPPASPVRAAELGVGRAPLRGRSSARPEDRRHLERDRLAWERRQRRLGRDEGKEVRLHEADHPA